MKCEIEGYEDIEFKVGQKWRTRDGNTTTIIHIEKEKYDNWPIKCDKTRSYMVNGIYSSNKDKSSWDLVSPDDVKKPVETYKDNADLWEYADNDGLKVVENTEYYPLETSVEDKMVEILHQLLRQRDRDLEKLSLVFNTFIEMEKMKNES